MPAQPKHTFVVNGTPFDVYAKYRPVKQLGKGAYGVVVSCEDTETHEFVAIKKVVDAFQNLMDAKRTLREIKLLHHMGGHENIVRIKEIIVPGTLGPEFKDVYIVYELMDTDLNQVIKSNQPLSDQHAQYFLYQVLRGLKYVHSCNILHRDLKPANLLVNANCDLKIADFGLARVAAEKRWEMTEYVVTRWYRAPELLLSEHDYGPAVDVWSVGCIFAEVMGRKPLFVGRDYLKQLDAILKVSGSPTEDDLSFVQGKEARNYILGLPHRRKVSLKEIYPEADPAALDLLDMMLEFNPKRRITVEAALKHPYFASLHDPDDEPVSDAQMDFAFEREDLTVDKVKAMIADAAKRGGAS